jgi:hypothetical protein
VVVDADAARPPFGEHVRLDRQQLEERPIKLFQELLARHPEAADRSLLVELPQQIADRRVQLGEAVEYAIAQAAEQPALDDQHAGFDRALETHLQASLAIRPHHGAC